MYIGLSSPAHILSTLRTSVSEGLQPACGVHTTSAASFPLGTITPFSGETVKAPRFVHAKEAVAFPALISVRGCRSVDSRLSVGNYRKAGERARAEKRKFGCGEGTIDCKSEGP